MEQEETQISTTFENKEERKSNPGSRASSKDKIVINSSLQNKFKTLTSVTSGRRSR